MRSPSTDDHPRDLRRLARLHGLELAYWDVFGRHHRSPVESVLAVLRGMGAPVRGVADCGDALRRRRIDLWERRTEPVVPVRTGSAEIPIRHAAAEDDGRCRWELTLESGEVRRGEERLVALPVARRSRVDGREMVARRLAVPAGLPAGYHSMELELAGRRLTTLLVCAPEEIPRASPGRRAWGLFAPLYALRADPDRGIGSYEELDELARLVDDLGGRSVATLPLLPVDPDALGGPSPYAAISRLFWGEHHLDLGAIPELSHCEKARRRLAAVDAASRRDRSKTQGEAGGTTDGGAPCLVDYAAVGRTVRRVLEPLAAAFFDGRNGERVADGIPMPRRDAFRRFLEARPEVRDYARFRALTERYGKPWQEWPAGPRERRAEAGDHDPAAYRTHLYAQWLAHEQLGRVAEGCRERDGLLYLDLPLGVPDDSYDVWRHRESFCRGMSVGAPPDTFFPGGQNWAFPPLHPRRVRARGHRYFRACLRHHLSAAGMLRLDHVMGLHRLYWIPRGFEATEGVYARYPARELWAVLRLEAGRAGARVVGEDLGTVPATVRRGMRENGAHRMFVVQTEVAPDRVPALDPAPEASVASVNTHDMPTFAGFWESRDLDDLRRLGHMDEETHSRERALREARKRALVAFLGDDGTLTADDPGPGEVLRATLRWLADSPASELIVNVEDLWLEPAPQNVPGTGRERPNWRRRLPCPLDRLDTLGPVTETLAEIDRRRRRATPGDAGVDDDR